MDSSEFGKIWTLFGELFPASPKLKNKNSRMVWEIGLAPYELGAVTQAVMEYARRNKFFPDLADITASLPMAVAEKRDETERNDVSWALPYVQKLMARATSDPVMALALHLVGLQTWPEAEAAGMSWGEWTSLYNGAKGSLLPPTYASLKRQGMTYEETCRFVEQAWSDFWAAHGAPERGVP